MPEQWPVSYLKVFDPFVTDPFSEADLTAMFDAYCKERLITTPPKTWKVLDICCGTGVAGRAMETHLTMAGKPVEVTFLDRSSVILKKSKRLPGDKMIRADVTSMSKARSGRYDVVTCRYGFNNLAREEWMPALEEVLRVLKPGGLFLLQDHFVPGPTFSALVNEAEQFLARLEKKEKIPYIFSTEAFNAILDDHPLVESHEKTGYGLFVNIWDRLRAKKEILPDFEAAKMEVMRFYREICLRKFKVRINRPEEYIHVFNVTYAIMKRA